MEKLFGELLTTLVIFTCVVIFAVYKHKKDEKEQRKNEDEFDKNLKEFGEFFGINGESFSQICLNLEQSKRVKKIDKDMSLSEFVAALGKDSFKSELKDDKKIDENLISQCVKNLKQGLALGLYPLGNGSYLAFLEEENTLFHIIDMASKLGENIIYCD